MLAADHMLKLLWTRKKPQISFQLKNAFFETFQSDDTDQIFVDNGCTTATSLKQTFEEKLINAHKLVYQLIAPHYVD